MEIDVVDDNRYPAFCMMHVVDIFRHRICSFWICWDIVIDVSDDLLLLRSFALKRKLRQFSESKDENKTKIENRYNFGHIGSIEDACTLPCMSQNGT